MHPFVIVGDDDMTFLDQSTRHPLLISTALAGVWTGTLVVLLSLLATWLVPRQMLPDTFTPAAISFFAVTFFAIVLVCSDLRLALWRAKEKETAWAKPRLTVPRPDIVGADATATDFPVDGPTAAMDEEPMTVRRQTNIVDPATRIRDLAIRHEQDRLQYQLVLRELTHRARNVFAVVLSIAQCSLRKYTDKAAYEHFEGRLIALSRAHDLLNQGEYPTIDIGELVTAIVSPFSGGRVSFAGPPFHVPSRLTLPLALSLHELCTNASKYGALSVANGHVAITWEYGCSDNGEVVLRLRWTETGGPPVTPPSRPGFGSQMIRAALASNSGANTEIRYCPEGLVCELTVSLERAVGVGAGRHNVDSDEVGPPL